MYRILHNILLVVVIVYCCCLFDLATTAKLAPIVWDSRNEWFRNQIDGSKNALLQARIRDTVDIYCPTYNSTLENDQVEYSAIYMVTKYGYENCVLDKPRQVGRCTNPGSQTVIKLTFRDFTPLPFGLEFKPGNSYYFVSTSNGSYQGLHNTQGGLCKNQNLRLRVQVEPEQQFAPKTSFHNLSPFAYNAHPSQPVIGQRVSHFTERQETLIKTIDDDEISMDESHDDRRNELKSKSNVIDHREKINHPKFEWNTVRDNNIQSDRSNNLDHSNQANFETGSGFDSSNKERLILYEIHETYELDKSHSSKLKNSARSLRRTFLYATLMILLAILRLH